MALFLVTLVSSDVKMHSKGFSFWPNCEIVTCSVRSLKLRGSHNLTKKPDHGQSLKSLLEKMKADIVDKNMWTNPVNGIWEPVPIEKQEMVVKVVTEAFFRKDKAKYINVAHD